MPFNYPSNIRKAIYTTNTIEPLNNVNRKATKSASTSHRRTSSKSRLPDHRQTSEKWTVPIRNWKPDLNRFMIKFESRLKTYIQHWLGRTQNDLQPPLI